MLWAVHNNLAVSEWIIHARFQFVLFSSDWQITDFKEYYKLMSFWSPANMSKCLILGTFQQTKDKKRKQVLL